jgi:hypothetical protein
VIECARRSDVIVVAEEAGQGLLPLDSVSRAWLDQLGEAVQRLSAAAERVDYVRRSLQLPRPHARLADPSAFTPNAGNGPGGGSGDG